MTSLYRTNVAQHSVCLTHHAVMMAGLIPVWSFDVVITWTLLLLLSLRIRFADTALHVCSYKYFSAVSEAHESDLVSFLPC